MLEKEKVEKILTDPGLSRYSILPIEYPDIDAFYETQEAAFWVTGEVDLSNDIKDWENLTDNERYFIKQVLAFFNNSDGIVNENLAENFVREVQYPEAKHFYGIQIAIENIHSRMYSLLIETYVRDKEEKNKLFNALEHFPAVAKKGKWALDWISSESFVDRLIAFVAVEGIFFSGK